MKLIFLPGMDGTGLLFQGLLQHIPKTIETDVICLNDTPGISYREQAEHIASALGDSSVVLVAESYSGRLAYEVCHILGCQILKVIYIASFVSCPSRLAKGGSILPEVLLNPTMLPNWLIQLLCFSGGATDVQLKKVRDIVAGVNPGILKQRLKNIAGLREPQCCQNTTAVYIRPADDRLVGIEAVHVLERVYQDFTVEQIEGGHFIAQTDPKSCAKVILKTISTNH